MANSNPFEGFDPTQLMEQTRSFWEDWQRQMSSLAASAGTRPMYGGNPFGAYGANPFAPNAGFARAQDPFGFGAAFAPRNPMQDALDQMNAQGSQWLTQMQALAAQFVDQAPSAAEVRRKWEDMMGLAESDGFNQLFNVMQNSGSQDFSQWLAQVQPLMDWFRVQAGPGDVPAFGLMREHQERWQQTGRFITEYQDAAATFAQLLGSVNQEAMNRFEQLLDDRRLEGKVIDSTRALFDLWVDAAESAYEKTALSREYREAYGDMVNAQMRVRLAVQEEVERMTAAIGIPGRSEIDAAYRKLTQLDREVRLLRDQLLNVVTGGTVAAPQAPSAARSATAVASPTRKATKKAAKKVAKKATKKVAKKAAKKVTKKVAKKATKKAVKKSGRGR